MMVPYTNHAHLVCSECHHLPPVPILRTSLPPPCTQRSQLNGSEATCGTPCLLFKNLDVHSHTFTHTHTCTHSHTLTLTHAHTYTRSPCALTLSHTHTHWKQWLLFSFIAIADAASEHLLGPQQGDVHCEEGAGVAGHLLCLGQVLVLTCVLSSSSC